MAKNEDDKRKSLSDNDMEFFKTFPNVEIRYNNRLHAKIYLNEKKCLITSLNLHDFSLKENIEVGILTKSRTLDILREFARSVSVSKNLIADSMDRQTADFAEEILEKSPKEFEKKVIMERRFWGLFKKTGESEIILNKPRTGFCLRTRQIIPLNYKYPYSPPAYKSWAEYNNAYYKENYCHSCGKEYPSSMAKPDCPDCYSKR